jgi:TonB family protein
MKVTAKLAVLAPSLLLMVTLALATQDQSSSSHQAPAPMASSESPKPESATAKTPAKLISGNDPEYTDSARDQHVEGTIILAVTVNEKGKVTAVKIVNPLEKSLDRRAMNAVKHWKFAPATLEGKPVASEFNVSVDFRLNR